MALGHSPFSHHGKNARSGSGWGSSMLPLRTTLRELLGMGAWGMREGIASRIMMFLVTKNDYHLWRWWWSAGHGVNCHSWCVTSLLVILQFVIHTSTTVLLSKRLQLMVYVSVPEHRNRLLPVHNWCSPIWTGTRTCMGCFCCPIHVMYQILVCPTMEDAISCMGMIEF